jgi:tetratricopeptide (TPR) repeat protein
MPKTRSKATETYIFLCDPDSEYYPDTGGVIDNRRLPEIIKFRLSQGEHFITTWRCANTRSIQVEDRAYLVKTTEEPKGIIASGRAVAAPDTLQLRQESGFSDLSAAYAETDGHNYYIYLALDSVVDFDHSLEQRNLERQQIFQGVNFLFRGGGRRFAPDKPAAVKALASAWESHCLILQRQGKGRRLVDVFLERGDEARDRKEYDEALYYYYEALSVDPNYGKATNKIKQLERIIETNPETTNPRIIITPPPKPLPVDQLTDLPLQDALEHIRLDPDKQDYSATPDVNEAHRRILVEIARRQGQSKFRQTLLEAYDYKCAVTGFDAGEALEAAHIIPYSETENNDPTNGLLLRADIHTLFDLNMLVIHPEKLMISLHPDLRKTQYQNLHNQKLRIPNVLEFRPNPEYLKTRLQQCHWINDT